MRPDARRFEKWESSISNRLGLRAAVRYALQVEVQSSWQRILALATTLRQRLSSLPSSVKVQDIGTQKCGIVAFTIDGLSSAAVVDKLSHQGFNLTVSTAASTRVDMEQRGLADVVRASVHYFNTEEELGALTAAVRDLVP